VVLSPGRRAAADALAAVGRGRRLDLALDAAARGLAERERRFAHEAAYGTMRMRGRLDHLLSLRLERDLAVLDPPVLDALRLGAYQLLFMDGVPAYAAVSQAVLQARASGSGRAAGLVNAVLRALAAAGDDPSSYPPFDSDPAGFLSTWGSHPRWLVERWLERWPAAEVRALVEADNARPPLALVPLDGDLDSAAARLEAAGARVGRAGRGAPALLVEGLAPWRALEAVPGIVQDPAAALVGRYAAVAPGQLVADLCAAPGGKALYLARTAVYVVAVDASAARVRVLRDNVVRAGLPVGVVRARAESPPLVRADLVLVDVPCTGTGTLRRHPDARWRLRPGDPARLAVAQARLVAAAAGLVPSGGVLVYSTCTLEPEEDEGVVRDFLDAHPDFRPAPPEDAELEDVDDEGRLVVLPQRSGFDGAFAARLRRR
jgi:16S rRNA (cytosine967-C5)-methyltransferase